MRSCCRCRCRCPALPSSPGRRTFVLRRRFFGLALHAVCCLIYGLVFLLLYFLLYRPVAEAASARVETTCTLVRSDCGPTSKKLGDALWEYRVAGRQHSVFRPVVCTQLTAGAAAARPCWYSPGAEWRLSFEDYRAVVWGPRMALLVVGLVGVVAIATGLASMIFPRCSLLTVRGRDLATAERQEAAVAYRKRHEDRGSDEDESEDGLDIV